MPLTSLQYINISNCKFSGKIPSSIQGMNNLQYLYATGNQLSGPIPSEISISNLQFIDLSNNQLEGQIPSSLGKIINLQHLNLSNNKISGNVPSSFKSLQNIQVLRLSGNPQLSGELPNLSDTLKECSFSSTNLCINGTRNHCTNGIKSCELINNTNESKTDDTPSKTEEDNTLVSDNNSSTISSPTLGPEDFSDNRKDNNHDKIFQWIALGFIGLLILCIIILILICSKRRRQKSVIIKNPIPGYSTSEIFEDENIQSYNGEDPDASIQICSLSRPNPQLNNTVPNDVNSQISSYDDSSLYESTGSKSSNYGSLHSTNYAISPTNTISNQGGAYTTNSLNRNKKHGTPVESVEQDLSDIVVLNNGNITNDTNSQMVATISTPPPKRISANLSSYTKSQSSPNLVRMNLYSVNQSSPPNGAGKRRLTNTGTYNGSPKMASASSSPNIDEKRSKHSSIPYPVSPFALKSSTVNTNQRKTYDTKRLSTSNDDAIHHNTVHVVNSRKNIIPYPIEKSSTTVTKVTNVSETSTSNFSISNSVHSSTPIMSKNKNRISFPSMNTKKPSILTKFSSQNNMNVSPLANRVENAYDLPSVSDSNEQYVNTNKTSINPSLISTNTSISLNDPKVNELTKNNISSQDHHSDDKDNNNHINSNISSNHSSLYNATKNTPIYTNNNHLIENPDLTEEIYVEVPGSNKLGKSDNKNSSKEYNQNEINNEHYEYNNIPEDIRQQIEEPQPPNYEEVFSESVYSPYIDQNNDEAIRMQLEMRRIEERQTRMEYLQRQIDNPDLSNTQRQKYIDALDRLMLE
ncbi:hypothetical protein BCR36DRAFT_374833 [Piromyces finnis]|uniref:L domain-like protein n=1 Tax=Piromyces finnis TaxID=1754191 RepID=A0A1Y1UVV9_9FUNG|nr:hypothetical protein BCR36DRAFT_374833 [Piromyces finnis]|eukprot:ORX42071.1 hypothetical protein BCR36DRAFT_374833 [Piromyces finnis]